MAEDRNQLEQQAMLLLQKDKKDEAIDVYLKILKLSKGDIRVRQKLADLYLALGRKPEAIRQLRDVAAGQVKEGQHRAAVVILKKLHELNPTDATTLGMLGDAQRAVGFDSDAKESYEKVIDMLEPKHAFPFVEKLVAISPGEIQPKVKLAEALARCGRPDDAFAQWVKLGQESRRRGSTLDQALFMERGLKLREEDPECLESAAEARIALGAPKEALVHIQKSYALEPGSSRVLSMLAQCFELMEQGEKAKKVLVQLAKTLEEKGEMVERVSALKRALVCDPEDAELKAEVGDATALASKIEMRLTGQEWSKPATDDEGAVVIRAKVLAEYGFPDRAKTLLEESNGLRETTSVHAMLGEVLVSLGEVDSAIAEMEKIDAGDDAREDIATRVLVLREDFDSLGAGKALEMMDIEVEDAEEDDGEMEFEMDEGDPVEEDEAPDATADVGAEGDRLAAAGDREGAIVAYQKALESDPSNEDILMKLGELIAMGGDDGPDDLPMEALEPVGAAAGNLSGFGGIVEKAAAATTSASSPSTPSAPPMDPEYEGLRGLLMLGNVALVEERIEGRDDLLGACLLAEISCIAGDAKAARRTLQEAMDEVDEDAPGYAEGLWGLARYAAMVGKVRTSLRLLAELQQLAPGHRAADIATLQAGMDALEA